MAAATTILLISGLGCRQDMHDEPKFFPQRGTDFYADGRSVRPQVTNTVARNQLHEDSYFYTGLINGREGDSLPFPVTLKVLARGQERYNIYCAPCHSRVGNGDGMIVQRGYTKAGNFQDSRLRTATLGHYFNVMSKGYGAMPEYAAQLSPVDRWAVAAYIRALQLSQNAQRSDVPAGTEVKPLKAIAASEGLPESFAAEWGGGDSHGIPGTTTSVTSPGTNSVSPARTEGATPATTPAKTTTPATPAAPTPAKTTPTKKETTISEVNAGHAIYAKNCEGCHTAQLTGRPPTFPSLIHVVSRLGEARVRHDIHAGKPPMPAFPNLSNSELDDLVAYLTTPSKVGH